VVAEQLDMATVFIREWRYLEGERREQIVGERRRYEQRLRILFREGASTASCAQTSTRPPPRCSSSRPRTGPTPGSPPGRDTDALADSFAAILVDGIRGYATPAD